MLFKNGAEAILRGEVKVAFDTWARLKDVVKQNYPLSEVLARVEYVREYEPKRESVEAFLHDIQEALSQCMKSPDNTLELIYVAARAIACLQQFGLSEGADYI